METGSACGKNVTKEVGMRVIDEAEAGGTVAIGDATIDGRQVVSVDVLGRNGG